MAIHIPKGEGIKIIKQYSEATTNDSIYILPIDGKYAEMIIVDKVGGKRKVGFSLPENLALHDIVNSDGEITTQGNTYLKTQIDTLLNIERTSREGKDAELEMEIQSETRARESKDNELKTAIETEQQERIAKDAEINETISTINNELNSEKTTREQADISLDGKIDNLKSIVESLSDWKNLMVNEDADAIINTITEVVSAFRNLPEGSNVLELLNAKVNISSIVNNLESEIENVPLSAKQGKILKDLINDTKALLEQKNTTQDTAISGKLDKTTTTISEPNAEFKYAYLTNEANETRRMLAGDLGKNVANSKPTSVAGAGLNMGAIWDIDTNNFPLRIKGLPDKSADTTFNRMRVQNANGQEAVSNGKAVMENLMDVLSLAKYSDGNYNNAFSEYLIYNPTTRQLAKSDRPQIVSNFNVPAYININHNTQVANVNWVPKPEWPQNLKETLEFVKNIQNLGFKKVQASEFVVKKMPNSLFPNSASSFVIPDFDYREGEMLYNGNVVNVPAGFRDLDYQANNEVNNALVNIFINKEFPTDKNWVFRFRHFKSHLLANNNGGSFIGFRSNINDNVHYDVTNDLVSKYGPPNNYMKYIANNLQFGFIRGGIDFLNSDLYIIKQGSIISAFFIDSHTGEMGLTAAEYNSDMKYIVFGINLDYSLFYKFYIKDISYWISE